MKGKFRNYFLEELTIIPFYVLCPNLTQIGGWKATQVAQLWQRDRTKLDAFSINVQRYSQNHAQNWIFGPPMGASGTYIYVLYLKFLTRRNLVAEFHRENVNYTRKTAN